MSTKEIYEYTAIMLLPQPLFSEDYSKKIMSLDESKFKLNKQFLYEFALSRCKLEVLIDECNKTMIIKKTTFDAIEKYFNEWYVLQQLFYVNISNYVHIDEDPLQFAWKSFFYKEGYQFSNTSIRYENIMIGIIYTIVLLAKALEFYKNKQLAKSFFDKAISIMENFVDVNMKQWKMRNEAMFPFECSVDGCQFYISIINIIVQRCHVCNQLNLDLYNEIIAKQNDDESKRDMFRNVEYYHDPSKKIIINSELLLKMINWIANETNKLIMLISGHHKSIGQSVALKLLKEIIKESHYFSSLQLAKLFKKQKTIESLMMFTKNFCDNEYKLNEFIVDQSLLTTPQEIDKNTETIVQDTTSSDGIHYYIKKIKTFWPKKNISDSPTSIDIIQDNTFKIDQQQYILLDPIHISNIVSYMIIELNQTTATHNYGHLFGENEKSEDKYVIPTTLLVHDEFMNQIYVKQTKFYNEDRKHTFKSRNVSSFIDIKTIESIYNFIVQ
jgi:hypothetical protein